MRLWMLAMVVAMGCGAPALAQPVDLARSAHVTERLVVARVGDRLRKTCPQAQVRWVRVWSEVRALKAWAAARGHTEASVSAFLDDRAQKDRIYGLADAYLRQAGFDGTPASACQVARTEVDGGTAVGALLRVPR